MTRKQAIKKLWSLSSNVENYIHKVDADVLINEIFDEFEQSLQLEDVIKADKQGWLTGYPQFGKFKKNAKIYIYTKEAKNDTRIQIRQKKLQNSGKN